jgi:hypothetical protein
MQWYHHVPQEPGANGGQARHLWAPPPASRPRRGPAEAWWDFVWFMAGAATWAVMYPAFLLWDSWTGGGDL